MFQKDFFSASNHKNDGAPSTSKTETSNDKKQTYSSNLRLQNARDLRTAGKERLEKKVKTSEPQQSLEDR